MDRLTLDGDLARAYAQALMDTRLAYTCGNLDEDDDKARVNLVWMLTDSDCYTGSWLPVSPAIYAALLALGCRPYNFDRVYDYDEPLPAADDRRMDEAINRGWECPDDGVLNHPDDAVCLGCGKGG